MTVETLLPERHRNTHRAHRTRHRAAARLRAMGGDLALMGRRRNGTEFPVEVSLSPITTTQGRRVVATVRDITTRLATEAGLRRNESRLRVLQDRERLARDMHDIVIQRLFAAGMGLQAVVGSITDPHVEQRVSDTVDELDRTIADLRRRRLDSRRAPRPRSHRSALQRRSSRTRRHRHHRAAHRFRDHFADRHR